MFVLLVCLEEVWVRDATSEDKEGRFRETSQETVADQDKPSGMEGEDVDGGLHG